jgi:AcrR family transcriptional regulator
MGPAGSANWNAILDSAEDILSEEGYGALTSRTIAERVGIKQRLIYYYFHTMDDLIVQTFRRLAVRDLQHMAGMQTTARPLHELWHHFTHTPDARLISEFAALANRIESLRVEVISFIEESRRIQVQALQQAMKHRRRPASLPAAAMVLFATAAGLLLVREAELGVTTGHADVASAVRQLLSILEPIPRRKLPGVGQRPR